jgi:hypothetical protein
LNLNHIDWKSAPEKLWGTVSLIGAIQPQSSNGSDDIREKMYTGDVYRGMEVTILEGDAKSHFGVVKGTRVKDGRTIIDVQTSTRTINTMIALDVSSVKERQYVHGDLAY